MKIGIIGTMGIPAQYGGFETLAEYLTKEKNKDFDFTVFCSKSAYPVRLHEYNGAKLKYIPLKANGAQSVLYDIWSLLKALPNADTVLILGVSGCCILPFIKIFSKKRIIVNIDGLEWKRDKWGKNARKFLKFSEKLAVKYADIVVADNKVIQEHVKNCYGKSSTVIPYGGDHCIREILSEKTLHEFPFLAKPYAFKVCRIEPENNIQMILKAFASHEKMNLVIVGNWENSSYSKQLRKEYEAFEHIHLLNPIYDQRKLNELRSNSFIYIHGHSAGGTNPSLVEAMYMNVPILAYGINYNKETTNHNALYFDDQASLVDLLEKLERNRLEEVGEKMYQIAKENYTWKKVSQKYAELF